MFKNGTPRYKQYNTTKFSNCFIKHKNQSLNGTYYSLEQHRTSLFDLFKLTDSNPPMLTIFVTGNDKRGPNLDGILCDLPFIPYIVNENYYIIDNKYRYNRSCNLNGLRCHAKDFLFFLEWLYNHYLVYNETHNRNQWILSLEDDVLLCPKLMESLLNIILNDDINNNTNLWYLGYGATAMFFRASYIVEYILFIGKYLNVLDGSQRYGIDLYVLQLAHKEHRRDIVASQHNLVYHPSSKMKNSSQNHKFSEHLVCGIPRKWKGWNIRYINTYNNNISYGVIYLFNNFTNMD